MSQNKKRPDPGPAAEKLRHVMTELIDTEKAYVRDLELLVQRYLEPLREETFLSPDEKHALFGNIAEILEFQKNFSKTLEEPVTSEPRFASFDKPEDFKKIIISLGGSFMYHRHHFKLYSTYAACHSKSDKVLDPVEGNSTLVQFLRDRYPKLEWKDSLTCCLIKPIQRVLKYPLLLSQMRALLDPESLEHSTLSDALDDLTKVSEHINHMMKVHKEYGAVFDSLVAEQCSAENESKKFELALDDFVRYDVMNWLNGHDHVAKMKKGRPIPVTVFIFRTAAVVLYMDKERRSSLSRMFGDKAGQPETKEVVKFKWMVPAALMQPKEAKLLPGTDGLKTWELVHSPSVGQAEKRFQLACSSADEKDSVLKAIRQVIKDFSRGRHSLKGGAKFDAKQTYKPYGGSRVRALGPKRGLRRPSSTISEDNSFDKTQMSFDEGDDYVDLK